MHTIANVGIPMLMVHMPVLLIALLPVVYVETWWIERRSNKPEFKLMLPVFIANLVSTLVGVPLTWLALVAIQLASSGGGRLRNPIYEVTLQSPWLIPDEKNLDWKVPIAALVLCPVFFAISALIECRILRTPLRNVGIERSSRIVWTANAITYALIAAFWLATLAFALK
ncbi:MAG: hypothetical protein K2W85_05580 [Phycisphaerales bacterium]|nr:hypothetical protein [Phycisphaerales bacterium]